MKEKILAKKKELEGVKKQLQAQLNYVIGQLALCDDLLSPTEQATEIQ